MASRTYKENREHTREFDSMADLLDFIGDARKADRKRRKAKEPQTRWGVDSETNKAGYEWTLGASLPEAMKLASEGWQEGRERMVGTMSDALNIQPIEDTRDEWVNDTWGYLPDAEAYLAGSIFCMQHLEAQPAPTEKVVILRCGIGSLGHISATRKANWGIAVCVLVDQLENLGKSVEIHGVYRTEHSSGSRVATSVVLKQAGEPLDLDRMAFALGHSAMQRRLLFRQREEEAFMHSYGGTVKLAPVEDTVTIDSAMFYDESEDLAESIAKVAELFNEQTATEVA